jgi:hypothetical protein
MAKSFKKRRPQTEGAEMAIPSEEGQELSDTSTEDEEQPQPPIKKQKGMSKSKAPPSKKVKMKQMTLDEKEKLLKDRVLEAKVEFMKNKKDILDEMPETYKNAFGQIGFAKWGKTSLPVLVVNPFDAPPRPDRELWLRMFEKASGLLVFWSNGYDHNSQLVYFLPQPTGQTTGSE